MAEKTFVVTESKSTKQKLVDYNSNTLLPYTVLDAITDYSTTDKPSLFGIDIVSLKLAENISNHKVNTINSGSTEYEYYPLLFNAAVSSTGDYKAIFAISNTQSLKYQNINDDYGFLSQDGTFKKFPTIKFLTTAFTPVSLDVNGYPTNNINNNTVSNTSALSITLASSSNAETKNYDVEFLHDSHFTAINRVFAPAGSFRNLLNAIDSADDESTYRDIWNTGGADGDGYLILHNKYIDTQNGVSTVQPVKSRKELSSKYTIGFATNLNSIDSSLLGSRRHNIMLSSREDDTQEPIIADNGYRFIVYQEKDKYTKFLKVPTSNSIYLKEQGLFANDSGRATLTATTDGHLEWGSAGIDMFRKEDSEIHYLLGTPFDSSAYAIDSSTRRDSVVYSIRTYLKNGSIFQFSDERLKNFNSTFISLDDFMNIKVGRFTWKDDESATPHYGISAQSLQPIVPELVNDNDGVLSVEYDKLGALAIKGLQMIIEKYKDLEQRYKDLEEKYKSLSK